MAALRIFIHVQHLSGVGHTVRMQRLAVEIARRHQVTLLDGGRELAFPAEVQRLCVPRLARVDGQLRPLDSSLSTTDAFARRAALLGAHVEAQVPDAILVEHFPFSKWELQPEILHMLDRARQVNAGVKVIASVRDVSPVTRHEHAGDYAARVLHLLHSQFDALLVHGDPTLCTLADSFPQSVEIRLPVYHTGLVTAPAAALAQEKRLAAGLADGYVVASVGGGRDRTGLARRVERAWRDLRAQGALADRCLLIFGGLDPPRQREPVWPAKPGDIVRMGFTADFREWLSNAALSISCAGYNTCADLLSAAVPALLVPNTAMSDQRARARLLDRRRVATLVPEPQGGADPLGSMMLQAMGGGAMNHGLDMAGAQRSLQILEQLLGSS